jgi:type IV secretory pathway VirB9-like protein
MRTICLAIAVLSFSLHATAGIEGRTLICDFNGDNADKVYAVTTVPKVGTTFRLPDGWKIADFVVTDTESFHAESNGTIGIVTALQPNKSTSISIFTDTDKLFVFNINSGNTPVADQLVIIKCSNLQLFKNKVKTEAMRITQDAELRCNTTIEQKTQQMLFTINSSYQISDRVFSIDKVVDDGIFTYIRLPKSQERPIVYISEKNDQKHLEPVKYTDEGEYYVVHKVLPRGEKRFFLKLGNTVSEISRSN